MPPVYDPDYGNPYYDDENWCDESPPDEPEELPEELPEESAE